MSPEARSTNPNTLEPVFGNGVSVLPKTSNVVTLAGGIVSGGKQL